LQNEEIGEEFILKSNRFCKKHLEGGKVFICKKLYICIFFEVPITKYLQLLTWFSDFSTNIDEIIEK